MVDHEGVPAPAGSTYTDEDLTPEHRKVVAAFERNVRAQMKKMSEAGDKIDMPPKLFVGLMMNVLMGQAAGTAVKTGVTLQSFLAGCRTHYNIAFEDFTEGEDGRSQAQS